MAIPCSHYERHVSQPRMSIKERTLTSCSTFGSLCLAIWDIPLGLKMFSYITAGMNGGLNPMLFGWASQVVSDPYSETSVSLYSYSTRHLDQTRSAP